MTHPMFAAAHVSPVPKYRFDIGDGFRYRNAMYAFVESQPEGHVLRLMDGTNLNQGFTHQQIEDMLNSTDPLEYLPKHYGGDRGNTVFKTEGVTAALSTEKLSRLVWRDKICARVLTLEANGKLSRSDASLNKNLPAICVEIGVTKDVKKKSYKHRKVEVPSASTVRRWLRLVEKTMEIVALTDNYKGRPGSTTFSTDVIVLMERYAKMYADSDRYKMNQLFDMLVIKIAEINEANKGDPSFERLKPPEIKAFRKRIADLGALRIYAGRNSVKAAKQRFAAQMEGAKTYRPLERVEMDEYKTDLHTVLAEMGVWQTLTPTERKKIPKIRLWITAILDTATRISLATQIHADAPSLKTAIAGVEMATRDKTAYAKSLGCQSTWEMEGTFELIATDSAAWYISEVFYMMIRDMGSQLMLPPTGAASARGTIERFFKTVSGQAFDSFPGRTWSNPTELGDVDALKEAGILLEQVRPLITRFVVDVYHHTPHAGLAMETPYDAWKRLRAQYKVKPSPRGARRRHIFGTSVTAKIKTGGFTVSRVEYQDVGLQQLVRGKKNEVLVRVNHADLGAASYYDGVEWRTAKAKDPLFEGMSLWEWLAIVDAAKTAGVDQAKLSQSIRVNALKHFRETGRVARLMAGLPDTQLSDEEFSNLQKWLQQNDRKVISTGNADSFYKEWRPSQEYLDRLGLGSKLVRDRNDIDVAAKIARQAAVEDAVAEAAEPAKMASGKSLITAGYN